MSASIVVGVDGTDGGRRALEWAVRHAAAQGARLLVASVYFDPADRPGRTPPPRVQAARKDAERHLRSDLDAVLAKAADRPQIDTIVIAGDVTAHTLAQLAADADLLVVGSHGHGALTSRLLGTVSMGCVESATCPVVVVPARDRATERATARAAAPALAIDPAPFY